MTSEELDNALEELENRLDRLRALYEQYFLGIEKIEPSVQRKDVDRRFWMLRREQIRNTARRFRLQTITQRYNTFQQYWARICREIENGTYVRHMLRAEKLIGELDPITIAAKKRQGMFRRGAEKRADRERTRSEGDDQPQPADGGNQSQLGEAQEAPRDAAPRADNGPAQAVRDDAAAPEATGARAVPPAPAARPKQVLEQLDLDWDIFGDEPVRAVEPAKPRPASPANAAPTPARPAPALPARQPPSPSAALPPPSPPAPVVNAPPAAAEVQPFPAASSPSPSSAVTAAGLTRPVAAPPPRAPRLPLPAPRPPPLQPAPVAAAAPRAESASSVTDERLRQLHARLVATKRELNEQGSVSVDGLAKSLRAVEDRLRQQHGNRQIDFDVVVKDGKAVVKPILR